MKTITKTILLISVLLVGTSSAFAAHFKLVNDTTQQVRIHTGSGVVSMNKRGGMTSITCTAGRKVYTAPKGIKDRFLFKVTSDMCNKTVKLSKYM
jgi:hypothetical protein